MPKVLVSNLPPDTTAEELKEHFPKYSAQEHARIIGKAGEGS